MAGRGYEQVAELTKRGGGLMASRTSGRSVHTGTGTAMATRQGVKGPGSARPGDLSRQAGPAYMRVLETVRAEILGGHLEPGQALAEAPLAQRLGVSRAPVREAIRRLEQAGLIVRSVQEGLRVARPTPTQVAQLYALRAALEGFAAHEAAEGMRAESPRALEALATARRAVMAEESSLGTGDDVEVAVAHTNVFHDAVLRAARNVYLSSVMKDLEDRILLFRNTSLRIPGSPERYHEAHGEILEAIEAGDTDLARERMAQHVREAAGRVRAYLEGTAGAGLP